MCVTKYINNFNGWIVVLELIDEQVKQIIMMGRTFSEMSNKIY